MEALKQILKSVNAEGRGEDPKGFQNCLLRAPRPPPPMARPLGASACPVLARKQQLGREAHELEAELSPEQGDGASRAPAQREGPPEYVYRD